jgi:hypothetical protein
VRCKDGVLSRPAIEEFGEREGEWRREIRKIEIYFYLSIHNRKREKILQEFRVPEVHDKYRQSPKTAEEIK